MPCCHKDQSSVQFCEDCIAALCSRSSINTFSCPICRSFVALEDGHLLKKTGVDTCSVCHNISHIESESPRMCGGCAKKRNDYGRLRYECEQCHRLQHIAHPVFRYQLTTSSFTRIAGWTCHQGCRARTAWRLLMEDVPRIAPGDRPPSWNSPACRFYEIIETLDEAKQRSIERRAGFWSCMYYAACVAGAVKALDLGVTLLSLPRGVNT